MAPWLTLALVSALWASGCSGNDVAVPKAAAGSSSSSMLPGLFQDCTTGRGCEAGLQCVAANGFSQCQQLCQSDADCASTIALTGERVPAVCGTLSKNVKACAEPCTTHYVDKYKCVDGHPIGCDALDETECTVCGCGSDKSLRCVDKVGCQPKLGLDAECQSDDDCISGNCDLDAHVCRVAVGSPCTVANCARCVESGNGTYCSRGCGSDFQCNGLGCARELCVPLCAGQFDDNCPGECEFHFHTGSGVPDTYTCYCGPMDCKVLSAPPDVGNQCDEDSDCGTDGVCLHNHPFQLEQGVCSKHCSAEKPCSKGRTCVDVPCNANEPNTCGALCLNDCMSTEPRCLEGECRSLKKLAAESVEVCDFRKPDGTLCNAHNDCQSTLCTDGKCAPAP